MSDPYAEDTKSFIALSMLLGKEVWILFENDLTYDKFYHGCIKECKVRHEKDRPNLIEHFVEFDDGDEGWYNLKNLENKGMLRWTKPIG